VTLSQLTAERQVAVRAVRDAARTCRAIREAFRPDQAETKSDSSPVTVADYASQALISLALAEAFPDDSIMGEETAASLLDQPAGPLAAAVVEHVGGVRPDADLERICWALDRCGHAGGTEGRHWTLDPVDGTKGFLRNQQYAVALALIEAGQVVLGVLACPNLPADPANPASSIGSLFVAERGGGAWQLPLDAGGDDDSFSAKSGRRIRVADISEPSQASYVESYESAHSSHDHASEIAEALGITRPSRRMDSQTKYAVVARGEAEIYLRLPNGSWVEQVWDHAAGSLLVTEAGGRVSDVRGDALDFSAGRRLERNRGVVVAPAAIHAEVLAATARVLEG
jgi:3'(2'), 5'-bisphosphate nucleotidase